MFIIRFFLIMMVSAQLCQADTSRGSLFLPTSGQAKVTPAGLFVGSAEGGMFAKLPPRQSTLTSAPLASLSGTDVQIIRALIQEAESRQDGYDAVQFGARIKPAKKPTQMTLTEIFKWIDDTPGQPHAIGRYQFIPKTLRRVVEQAGIKPSQRFSPTVQDKLADVLLGDAGLQKFRAGTLDRRAFMHNLAKIWAGLPTATGKSHYDGYAGNKAMVSWAHFDKIMKRISPKSG